jgi:Glycosyl hydrolase family 26
MMHRPLISLLLAAAVAGGTAACGSAAPTPAAAPPAPPVLEAADPLYIGMTQVGMPASYAPVTAFASAIRHPVNLAMYYSGWSESFRTKFAEQAWKAGTMTVVDMDPSGLAGIIAGDYDVYLRRFAAEVKAFGHPVVISFGHEANGDWFGYGYKHTAPGTFIAAYRTVHDVITRAGATNVVWLWTVNIPAEHQTEPDAAVWPGASYVTWAGIDGYDWTGKATFTQTFGAAVAAVRAITSKPVLIAETSVVPGPHAASQVASLFAGIRADGLIGLVWFNTDKNGFKNTGDTHDWRLQNDPAGLAAFRAAIKNWR